VSLGKHREYPVGDFGPVYENPLTGSRNDFAIKLPQGGGGGSATIPGPLQVSTRRPPGTTAPWDNDPGATVPHHVWVWWGLVGDKIPDNIDDPVILAGGPGTYWVYVEGVIDQTIVNSVTPLEIVSAEIKVSAAKPVQDPPDPVTGNPPVHGIYLLAQVIVTEIDGKFSISGIRNSGTGSLGAYVYIQDIFYRGPLAGDPAGSTGGMVMAKNIAWYRS